MFTTSILTGSLLQLSVSLLLLFALAIIPLGKKKGYFNYPYVWGVVIEVATIWGLVIFFAVAAKFLITEFPHVFKVF